MLRDLFTPGIGLCVCVLALAGCSSSDDGGDAVTPLPSPEISPTPTPTPPATSPTPSTAPTPEATPTQVPTPRATVDATATPDGSPSPSPSPAASTSPTPVASPTPTPTPDPSPTPTPDPTPTPTPDPTPTPTPTPQPQFGLDARPANPDCVAPARRPQSGELSLRVVSAFPQMAPFSRPIFATQAPGDGSRWYVVEQSGIVRRFDNRPDARTRSTFIDIRSRVNDGPNEAGLLSMAFHPDFQTNGQVFLSYTATESGRLVSRVSRFVSDDGGDTADPASEEVLLRARQPFGNHNGGHIAFGPPEPDRYLYIALGDGGGAGDPEDHGRDPSTLLGAILRIDVDAQASPYGIPADNPFASGVGGAREIFAWGLRNPWRFSFDREDGLLFAGDVGQGALEEVDIVELGHNYGWNIMEGTRCYNAANCDRTGLTLPVAEYGRSAGYSITGGYVYRGGEIPELFGTYIYGDFGSGQLWGLAPDPVSGELEDLPLLDTSLSISSFAQAENGELYLIDLFGGRMYQLEDANPPGDDTVLTFRLSDSACVAAGDPTRPAAGFVPYEVIAPLWSDEAEKTRYIAMPDGAQAEIRPDGDLDLPPGTVTMKVFTVGGQRVETRFFVHHAEDGWAGYTYAWNAEGTEATLLRGARTVPVPGGDWEIPSRAQCMQCHTAAGGFSLGLELGQLAGEMRYPNGRLADQRETWEHIGLFAQALPVVPPNLVDPAGSAPVAERARAYLHSNCSNCHRPGGTGGGGMDLRHQVALRGMRVCYERPKRGNLGVSRAELLAPGEPERSLLSVRMHRPDAARMPPLATRVVDPVGTAAVDDWIRSLTFADCDPP